MSMVTTQWHSTLVVVCLCLAPAATSGQDNKTVIGPSNEDLYAGAKLLMAGDAEEGVQRTLRGLGYISSQRDRIAALSNLCAGYLMLEQAETGLEYCNQALELNDENWRALSNRALAYVELGRFEDAEQSLARAEAVAPNARNVKRVRSMLEDATDPVAPHVIIDDRRQPADIDGN